MTTMANAMGDGWLSFSPPENLKAALDGFYHLDNLDGLIVTVPHKIAILQHLAELAPMAARSGAVNVIKRRPGGG